MTSNYLALEFASNKNLVEYLMHHPNRFVEEKWVRYWFKQMLNGLIHMKNTNHSHLDIKIDNILLDTFLNIKIADFGFA